MARQKPDGYSSCPTVDAMPPVEPGEMRSQGMTRDTQGAGHFLIREIRGDQADDLSLSWGKPRRGTAAPDEACGGIEPVACLDHGTNIRELPHGR